MRRLMTLLHGRNGIFEVRVQMPKDVQAAWSPVLAVVVVIGGLGAAALALAHWRSGDDER
jgi:hypothetical protein